MWACLCDCGKETTVSAPNLTSGNTKSCGCLNARLSKERNTRHGHCADYVSSKTYQTWQNMHKRCYSKSDNRYADYGGRGITVCERWAKFENFLADMGEPPTSHHSIERQDNNGNYTPENCVWASKPVQMKNRRNAYLITHEGQTKNLCDWAVERNIKPDTIAARLKQYGWTVAESLEFTPRLRPSKSL